MIGVRFNNLLLFNLVFSLPLGDEIEPVQRDVNVIIYIGIPFLSASRFMMLKLRVLSGYKG